MQWNSLWWSGHSGDIRGCVEKLPWNVLLPPRNNVSNYKPHLRQTRGPKWKVQKQELHQLLNSSKLQQRHHLETTTTISARLEARRSTIKLSCHHHHYDYYCNVMLLWSAAMSLFGVFARRFFSRFCTLSANSNNMNEHESHWLLVTKRELWLRLAELLQTSINGNDPRALALSSFDCHCHCHHDFPITVA